MNIIDTNLSEEVDYNLKPWAQLSRLRQFAIANMILQLDELEADIWQSESGLRAYNEITLSILARDYQRAGEKWESHVISVSQAGIRYDRIYEELSPEKQIEIDGL